MSLNVDSLIYNFNLQVGDTFRPNVSYGKAVVTDIDSILLLDGEWRKHWWFYDPGWETSDWIEGIGSTAGVIGTVSGEWEGATYLTCFRKNEELLFEQLGGYANHVSCDEINGIGEANNLNLTFQISPNPTTDFFTINFSSPNFSSAQIRITDVLGRNLFSEEIKGNQPLQISTQKFSAHNLLFCELWLDGKLMVVKKVLMAR